MAATPRRDTSCELALRSAVHRLGLRFRADWPIPGTRRRADLAFIKAKVVVDVRGCYWHLCPRHRTWPLVNAAWWREKLLATARRDRDTVAMLRRAGWSTVIVWEHEDPERAARRVRAAVVRATARLTRP